MAINSIFINPLTMCLKQLLALLIEKSPFLECITLGARDLPICGRHLPSNWDEIHQHTFKISILH